MNRQIIDENDGGTRIDQYMASLLPEYSRSVIQGWIADEKILVNGKKVKQNYRLKEEDLVEYSIT